MKSGLRLLFFLLVTGNLMAGAVRLANDSAYKLRAVVRAADGTYLSEVIVMPQHTLQWNDYWGGLGYYNQSRTPYTIYWFCLDGGTFSVCSGVASGSTVTALTCDGSRACRPSKKQTQPPPRGAPTEEYLPEQEQQEDMEQQAGPPSGFFQ